MMNIFDVKDIRLQPRDLNILKLTNSAGFMTKSALQDLFFDSKSNMSKRSTSTRRVRQLINAKILKKCTFKSHNKNIYSIDTKGKTILKMMGVKPLPPINSLNLETLYHDEIVLKVLALFRREEKLSNCTFFLEREIQREEPSLSGIPDIKITHPEGLSVAIEVELEAKSKSRIRKKLDFYEDARIVDTFYICSSESIKKLVLEVAEREIYSRNSTIVITLDEFFKRHSEIIKRGSLANV